MKTILIVEDSKEYRECLKFVLERYGCQVIMAANSWEALQQALENEPDLILMDYMLPGQDGAEIALKMREQPLLRRVPIVFLTAMTSNVDDDSDGIMVGHEQYPTISKMASQEQIIRKISDFLGN